MLKVLLLTSISLANAGVYSRAAEPVYAEAMGCVFVVPSGFVLRRSTEKGTILFRNFGSEFTGPESISIEYQTVRTMDEGESRPSEDVEIQVSKVALSETHSATIVKATKIGLRPYVQLAVYLSDGVDTVGISSEREDLWQRIWDDCQSGRHSLDKLID